jgi:hypothetical protein
MFRNETYALLSIIALASVAGGYAMPSSNAGLAAGHVVKVDFDQTLAGAAVGHRELAPKSAMSQTTTSINRTNKGDRSSVSAGAASGVMKVHTIAVRRPAPTPKVGCEALAAAYVDVVLGRIMGRCVV